MTTASRTRPQFDHAVLITRDLGRCADAFRRMGFTVSPRGEHDVLQTLNHTIVFPENYLELLAVKKPLAMNVAFGQMAAAREGIWFVVLRMSDPDGLVRALRAQGIETEDPVGFSRIVEIDGKGFSASFRIVRIKPQNSGQCPVFYCQHLTPELVYLANLKKHDNRCVAISAVMVIAADPATTATALHAVTFPGDKVDFSAGMDFRIDSTLLRFVTPAEFVERYGTSDRIADADLPAYGAITFTAESLSHLQNLFQRNAVPFRRVGRALLVDSDFACGVTLIFE